MSQEALHCFHTDLNVFILGGGGLFVDVSALLQPGLLLPELT